MKQTLTQRIKRIEKHVRQIDVVLDSHGTDLYHLRNSDPKPYTAQASTSKQTNPVCCHCEKDVNKPLTDSKPNKELRDKIMGLRSSRNFTTGIENEAYKDAIDDVLNLINK